MVTETELAWIAGFFDGEGCIQITRHKTSFSLRIDIVQKYPSQLKWIQEKLGYGRVRFKQPRVYGYMITTREDVQDFIKKIKPYCQGKSVQLELAEQFLSLPYGYGSHHRGTHEWDSRRQELMDSLKQAKRIEV